MKGLSKTIIAFGIDGVLGVLIRVFFYRIFTASDYGYAGFLVTSAYFFAVLTLMGSDYALIYSLANGRRYKSVLSLIYLLPITGAIGDRLITRSLASALLAYLSAVSFAGASALVGKRMYDELIALLILKRFIQAIGMFFLYRLLGVQGVVLGIALSMIPGALVIVSLSLSGLEFKLEALKGVASLSGAAFLITSSLYIDKLILGKLLSFEEFSGYYLAFQAILLFNAAADAAMRASTSEYVSVGFIDRFSKLFVLILSIGSPIASYLIAPTIPKVLGSSSERFISLLALTGLYLPAAMPLSFGVARMAAEGLKKQLVLVASLLMLLRASLPALMVRLGLERALIGFIKATFLAGIAALAMVRANREKASF